ncbi:uncharacterized protein LOC100901526 [Galendromus occidentalis]|uniref:Uncharacterized protein LOC100901526 n=1 Tax=Galendromus occidentalis TaxID=34638 RepID=A0AAJ6QP54_9ACAR|nr:uncharacterized protein LOC100901526 [Galendromus occidentalis]
MHRRKKTKTYSKSAISEAILSVPRLPIPPRSAYYNPLKCIIENWKIHPLKVFLEEYRAEYRRDALQWNADCLDKFVGREISSCVDEIISCCLPLGSLHDVTRFLFSKYSCQRARFSTKKGIIKVNMPLSRLSVQVEDNILMMSFIVNLSGALDKTNDDVTKVYKNNVYFVRKDGLSVFTIDRYDLVQPTAEAQFGIIYLLDVLPCLYILPLNMPVDVIINALQMALGLRLRVTPSKPDIPLHVVIKEEAKRSGLRRDVFPDHLKELLHFQSNTLRQMTRKPNLTKYPSQHECSFRKVSFELTEGLALTFRRRKRENILESLYQFESSDRLRVPAEFVRDVASNSKNSFGAFDFARVARQSKK